MLTGKWTPMNREVRRFNSLVNEAMVMSGKNDDDWMTRVEILYKSVMDMLQQQYELDHKKKMKRLVRETSARVELINSQKVAADLKVLQVDTRGMNPVDAAIINAPKAQICALYQPQN
nr:hypothetical protein [Tanacetum cinerariifolium]